MDKTLQNFTWAQKEKVKGEARSLCMLLYRTDAINGDGGEQYQEVSELVKKFCADLDFVVG